MMQREPVSYDIHSRLFFLVHVRSSPLVSSFVCQYFPESIHAGAIGSSLAEHIVRFRILAKRAFELQLQLCLRHPKLPSHIHNDEELYVSLLYSGL